MYYYLLQYLGLTIPHTVNKQYLKQSTLRIKVNVIKIPFLKQMSGKNEGAITFRDGSTCIHKNSLSHVFYLRLNKSIHNVSKYSISLLSTCF